MTREEAQEWVDQRLYPEEKELVLNRMRQFAAFCLGERLFSYAFVQLSASPDSELGEELQKNLSDRALEIDRFHRLMQGASVLDILEDSAEYSNIHLIPTNWVIHYVRGAGQTFLLHHPTVEDQEAVTIFTGIEHYHMIETKYGDRTEKKLERLRQARERAIGRASDYFV